MAHSPLDDLRSSQAQRNPALPLRRAARRSLDQALGLVSFIVLPVRPVRGYKEVEERRLAGLWPARRCWGRDDGAALDMQLAQRGMMIAACAFARTRGLAWLLKTRRDVVRLQERRLARMLSEVIPQTPFYHGLGISSLSEMPVMDKARLLANFPLLNTPGLTLDEVKRALDAGRERIGSYVVGQSSGTSGNRGYYVISDAERFVWLGTILAKALPDALWRRHRVALALPGLSSLYRSASSGSRIKLGFFDLAQGVEAWAEDLVRFAPDTIVAPPKVLRRLAERGQLGAQHIFSGSEVLDPLDRTVIEDATGRRVREIYMATEGLFGVACSHGTLHLAEDVVAFEWERPHGDSRLLSPLITDFTRSVQVMARYRMNDLLELAPDPCPCGSPLQAVARIEGRQDDVFELYGADGQARMVTPDVLRQAVLGACEAISDFRVIQTGPSDIEVSLDPSLCSTVDTPVEDALAGALARLGAAPRITVKRGLETPFDRKLRRVRRAWRPD